MPVNKEKLLEMSELYKGEDADKTFGGDLLTLIKYMSASRAIMHITHETQRLMLENPETPGVITGYEKGFGYFADSFLKADRDYEIIANIPRHSHFPAMKFTLVLRDTLTNTYDAIEVCHYEKLSEAHGYMRPFSDVATRGAGSMIYQGENIYKASSLDDYDNYRCGINAKVVYLSRLDTTEDAICISKSFAEKVKFHTIDDIDININLNEVMLNLYGNEDRYKVIPYIGEEVPDSGIICRKRRLEFDKASSSITNSSLMSPQSNDMSYKSSGKVVDYSIFCNNRLELESDQNKEQLLEIYLDQLRYYTEIYRVLGPIVNNPKKYKFTFKAKNAYNIAKTHYMNGNMNSKTEYKFTNNNGMIEFVNLNIKVANLTHLSLGYKLTNRFAAKSVIAEILEDEYMPRDAYGNVADIILSPAGVINRANPGQLYEHELNFCASRILDYMKNKCSDTETRFKVYLKFMKMVNEDQANTAEKLWNKMGARGREEFIQSIFDEGRIIMRQPPFHGTITLQQLEAIYDEFNIHPSYIRTRIEFENVPDMEERYMSKQQYDNKVKNVTDYVFDPERIKKFASGLGDLAKAMNNSEKYKNKNIIKIGDEEYVRPKNYYGLNDLYKHDLKEPTLLDAIAEGIRILTNTKEELEKEEFESEKVVLSINERGNLVRDIRSDERIVIADQYIMVLKQTSQAGFSARSIGEVSQSYIPIKHKKESDSDPYKKSPVKFGEMEVTNLLRLLPPETVHRFMAERATNIELRAAINKMLLTEDPLKLHDIPVSSEDIVGDVPSKILYEYIRAIGGYVVEDGERDPNNVYDLLPIDDIDKYLKDKKK